MASNHTEHFSLNQWQADDQVKRTDFNEDNAKIDAALNDLSGGLAAAQAEKADQTALDALAAEVAKKATTAALEAVRAAVPKIAVGTYTGTGTYGDSKPCTLDLTQTIGREPQLVLVRRQTDPSGRTKCLTLIRGAERPTVTTPTIYCRTPQTALPGLESGSAGMAKARRSR